MYSISSSRLKSHIKEFMSALFSDGEAELVHKSKPMIVKFEPLIPITPQLHAEIMHDLS